VCEVQKKTPWYQLCEAWTWSVSEGGLSHIRHARRSGIWPLEQDFFLRSSSCRGRRAASSLRFPTPTRSSSTPASLVDLVAQVGGVTWSSFQAAASSNATGWENRLEDAISWATAVNQFLELINLDRGEVVWDRGRDPITQMIR